MKKQIYPDGCDFEASTCYHRLVLELFFFATLLVVMNDNRFNGENHKEIAKKIFGRSYTKRLYKMFEAIAYLLKPDGRMPQIGDNDSGQFIKLYPRNVLDIRYLLAFGVVFFKEPKWKIKEFFESEKDIVEILILYGKKGKEIWTLLAWASLKDVKSKSFPDAGWYIMRDEKNYCIISCGPNGQNGNGGHAHNDKLSFELNIKGENFIVDPGTYVYTLNPEWRDKFRSASFHNTLTLNNSEQNKLIDGKLFILPDITKAKCIEWKSRNTYDEFTGVHYGYNRLEGKPIHKREVYFDKEKKSWKITDSVRGKGIYTAEWYFHLGKDVTPRLNKGNIELLGRKARIIFEFDTKLEYTIIDSWFSPEYGIKKQSTAIKFTTKCRAPSKYMFFLHTVTI